MREAKNKSIKAKQDRLIAEAEENADISKELEPIIADEWWKAAPKVGRRRAFETPEILEEAIEEYFSWCKRNPLYEVDYRGKFLQRVLLPRMRCFTMDGLCIFLGVNKDYFTDFLDSIKGRDDEMSRNYSRIIRRAESIIFTDKFTGAAAGFLNPLIISRDLGLRDNKEIEIIPSDKEKQNRDDFLKKVKTASSE